jgi:FtsP/CotA-like multicopper oxidase with cupredoxin domain
MKQFSLITLACCTLVACSSGYPPDATQSEVRMAEMMGITVEELRNQTPEEHMAMMRSMQRGGHGQASLPESETEVNVADLPQAKPMEMVQLQDGEQFSLTAAPVRATIDGNTISMFAYNGQIPGPVLTVEQGATITLEFQNEIPYETTVHWHGLRLENANDGVPGVTQDAVQKGDSFVYTLTFPDEGIYWYHPHVREDVQQDSGLYGMIRVLPKADDAYAPVHREEIVVLDDLLLTNGKAEPYGKDTANFPLMGRFGNVMLVNGSDADTYGISVDAGSVVRFFLANTASTRTFRVTFGDAMMMKLVGADVGRYERETLVDAVVLAPAERAIVDVYFDAPGTYSIKHESPDASYSLGTVQVNSTRAVPDLSAAFSLLRTNADVIADIDDFRAAFAQEPEHTLTLDIDMGAMNHGMMQHGTDGIEWEDTMPGMNRMMTGDDVQWKLVDEEGNVNMNIQWDFQKGDTPVIRIVNDDTSAHPMQHPIHFHGQRFLVIRQDGKPVENLVWKDTVLIPAGSTADLLFDMSNPGDWMIHCHIAEHLTNGMMGMFRVR